MKFFRVSALVNSTDYVENYYFFLHSAIDRLKLYDSQQNAVDLLLEEVYSYGPAMSVPEHSYDIHYVTLFVVKAGRDNINERIHYCFDAADLKDTIQRLIEDGYNESTMRIETTVCAHDNRHNPSKKVSKSVEGTMTLGELLRKKLEQPATKMDWRAEVLDCLKKKQVVGAIKALRTESRLGLKEAKDVIDYFMDREYSVDYDSMSADQMTYLGYLRDAYGKTFFNE